MGTSIVAGRDAPPILEPCKHILDFVALLIERLVIGQRDFRLLVEGMQGSQPLLARASLNQLLS